MLTNERGHEGGHTAASVQILAHLRSWKTRIKLFEYERAKENIFFLFFFFLK